MGTTVNTTVVVNQQTRVGFFSAALVVAFVVGGAILYWQYVLGAALVGAVLWAHWYDWRRKKLQHAAMVARADAEHAAVLRGEAAGVYGQYPPAVEP